MTWQLAILTHQVLETAFSLIYRKYAKNHKKDEFVTNALMYLLTVVPFGIIWSISRGGPNLAFDQRIWLYFMLAGFLFATGNITAYLANTRIEATIFTTIFSFRTVVIVLASWILLGEKLSSIQAFGAILVFLAGLYVINLSRRSGKRLKLTKYLLIAIISAILMGLAVTNEKYLLGNVDLATYLVLGWGLQAAFMTGLASKQMRRTRALFKDGSIKTILLLGSLRTVAGFAFINSLIISDNASLIGAIASLQIILVAIGGYVFLGERKKGLQKFGAAGLAMVGVVLLVY